jgi:hypothetical protein
MKSPITGGELALKKEIKEFNYRGEKVIVHFFFYLCVDSGEEFTDTALDTLHVIQAQNEYKLKSSPTPQSPPPIHPATPAHPAN